VHPSFGRYARKHSRTLLFAAAFLAAGCHHNTYNSGYGIGWVTLSSTPGDFTSYVVNVNSVSLNGAAYTAYPALQAVEIVDFTKLNNVSELLASASIPNDTYSSASIVLDYTNANISVMVNGVPTKATVVDSTGAAVTTSSTNGLQTINVTFDSAYRPIIQPTYGSSSALRLAINVDLAASNAVNMATSPPTVTIKPFVTMATSAPDTKPVRVRGPLTNSSIGLGTYTVYVRPFYDEGSSLGSLSIFNDPNATVYTINGTTYAGSQGLSALSQTSAGSTMTAAYTTYQPTPTLNASVTAGKFNSIYVIAGSSLEDFYTWGLEGDVIARSGNTLTLRGATLQFNNGVTPYISYIDTPDAVVLLGPGTIVTADDNTTLKGLDYNSVSVGQHIIARGVYTLPASGVTTLDATGTVTNKGSVRLVSTQLWGSLVSSAPGSAVMNLQTIDNWPVSIYNFTGNGAGAVTPAGYVVNTGSLAIPAGVAVGGPLWIDGTTTPFGSAPPDFNASAVSAELSVPARLKVDWTSTGTTAPFATLTNAGLTIDLNNPNYSSGVIRVGSESIDLKSSGVVNPQIVPATPIGDAGVPAKFLPSFAIGNLTSTANTSAVAVYNTFSSFVTQVPLSIVAATPALHFVAAGVYNRGTNTFTASSIDVVN
jgi:sulfur transfer complex TusBCD TusB component (DsrH family)